MEEAPPIPPRLRVAPARDSTRYEASCFILKFQKTAQPALAQWLPLTSRIDSGKVIWFCGGVDQQRQNQMFRRKQAVIQRALPAARLGQPFLRTKKRPPY